ncbi:aly/REF export factor 2-like [Spodoptera litura]|uniref:Aly/REF export factor 2-like n=1 Tax=Spodoptera litura TaxID=69820 RepID=A0A9J7J4I4_SPOLT|nr:aly/REF export factor 2-like [Spodoptera litura]
MVYGTQMYYAACNYYTPRKSEGSRREAGDGYRNDYTENVLRGRHRGNISKRSTSSKRPKREVHRRIKDDKCDRNILKAASPSDSPGPTKLIISNLDFEVSDIDIQEMFQNFGVLNSINYDRAGRYNGTADVVFERRADALKAMGELNGRTFDGKALDIRLATSQNCTEDYRYEERSPVSVNNGCSGNNVRFNRKSTRSADECTHQNRRESRSSDNGQAGAKGEKRPALTAEQLDAELEVYMTSVKEVKRRK